MTELPAGTLTFVFSDVEGSTRLLRHLGERYAPVVADHQRLMREEFARHGGREVDAQGDSFFVAFAHPRDAARNDRSASTSGRRRQSFEFGSGSTPVPRRSWANGM